MSDNTYTLYCHQNTINGKKYFGITSCSTSYRWNYGYGYKKTTRIGKAIKKYGWDSFTHMILFTGLSEQEAKMLEMYYIEEFSTQNAKYGYNITAGGDSSGRKGKHLTEEAKRKISVANKGRHHTEEAKANISLHQKGRVSPWKGKHFSEETLKRLSEVHKGRKMPPITEEHRRNLSLSHMGLRKGKPNPSLKGKHWKVEGGKRVWY